MTIHVGHCLDVLAGMESESIDCAITSPPYWGLRDYGDPGQRWPAVTYAPLPGVEPFEIPEQVASLGLEPDPRAYVGHLVAVMREVRRVLKPEGTLWLNLGDSYANAPGGPQGRNGVVAGNAASVAGAREQRMTKVQAGLKPKDLAGIPWLLAFALRSDGWYLRSEIIWAKPNPMPESVRDRPTSAHEYVFLLAKSARYHYDAEALKEPWADCRNGASGARIMPYLIGTNGRDQASLERGTGTLSGGPSTKGRNARTVWTITPRPYKGAHFATMPPDLIERAMLAGCPEGGVALDPFLGSGTVGEVAEELGRRWVGIEQSAEYARIAGERIAQARARGPRKSVKRKSRQVTLSGDALREAERLAEGTGQSVESLVLGLLERAASES